MGEWRWRIYEFTEVNGRSTIGTWLDAEAVSDRDRGQLVQKMDMLALHGTELLNTLLAGPIKSKRNRKMQSHIYKLIVHGEKMLRPILCKGPVVMDEEFTFLLGAIEVNRRLDQDAKDAELRRSILINNPARRIFNGRYE